MKTLVCGLASVALLSCGGVGQRQATPMARVEFVTSAGAIEIAVDRARAPRTSENFLRYVEDGFYDGGRFHRTVTPGNQPPSISGVAAAPGPRGTGADPQSG